MWTTRAALAGSAVLLLAGCASGSPQTTATSPTTTPTAQAPADPTAGPTDPTPTTSGPAATVSPTQKQSATGVACTTFGSTKAQSSGRMTLSEQDGETMRVGQHACFDRFVFQLQGKGEKPSWRVAYVDELLGQGSGDPVPLRGDATLEVLVGVWTVTDFPERDKAWMPYKGPTTIVTKGFTAIKEARNLLAFEGQTQIGLGIDKKRNFRVQLLTKPTRLVVDVYTGSVS